MARPTKWSKKLGDRLFDAIVQHKSFSKIEKLPGMPSRRTLSRWANDPEHPFCLTNARASEMHGLEAGAKVAAIADAILAGRISPKVGWSAGRLLQWTAERCAPNAYGARRDEAATVVQPVIQLPPPSLSDADLEALDPARRRVENRALPPGQDGGASGSSGAAPSVGDGPLR